MFVRRVELHDVRSYAHAVLDLSPGTTVLVGPNAQGKTNLLEAIHRAATGSSHRVAGDAPLVRAGASIGTIRVQVETDAGRRRSIELEVGAGTRTRTRVDGQDVRRASDAAGVVRVVLFAPEDLAIVRGDPSDRRRFLDDLLAQRRPAFAAARADFERALRQRNQLLKQARTLGPSARTAALATIDVWTDALVTHGTQVIAARLAAVRTLAEPVDVAYRQLADRPERIGVRYRSEALEARHLDAVATTTEGSQRADHGTETGRAPWSGPERVPDPRPIAEGFRAALDAVASQELARGVTLVGPHRDDLELTIGDLAARGYSSHGEAWSLALSLKLATFEVLAEVGDRPVVLLDDVFAELDTTRRQRLAEACAAFDQVLVTAAVEEDVPLQGAKVDVRRTDGLSTVVPRPVAGAA